MNCSRSLVSLCWLIFGLAPFAVARGEVTLSKVFTPHMVLQRGMPVPIWGQAAPGEQVTVAFRSQSKTATADAMGKWSVKLDALEAGGPDTLTVGDKKIDDVLVGEVWVGSGQSNMDGLVRSYAQNDPVLAEKAAKAYPKLRLLQKAATEVWMEATPENNQKMSAILFAFGLSLQEQLDVPVGIMVGAVGGTPSGFWLSEEMYKRDEACDEAVKKFAPTYDYEGLQKRYLEAKAKYDVDAAAWKIAAEEAKKAGKPVPQGLRPPQTVGKPGETNFGKVGQLFESFIRPYVGYGIKGVLWDQGESKTNIVGVDQVTLMGALIRGWRSDWGQGDFPFLYVQKPSGGGCAWDYTLPESNKADAFAELPPQIPPPPSADYSHAVFAQIMRYPKTHMVTASDLGSGIHPTNKSGYGSRAARVALATAYDKPVEWLGPVLDRHEIKDGKVVLHFTHVGQGLAFKNGERLQGFMIAGEDKKFVWAQAEIVGDTVEVSHAMVAKPASARYAWAGQFRWANLFNRDGLPAQPFRTDDW
jgi:sialate O-acetylesterase